MPSYRFRYQHGQSMPFATVEAKDDSDFFKTVLPAWEQKTGFKHVSDTVECSVVSMRKVPEMSTVGLGWELSDETRQEIEEIERNLRQPPPNILVGNVPLES
jgi:hypothetical protein